MESLRSSSIAVMVIASSNQNKLKEIEHIFSQNEKTRDIKLLTLKDINFFEEIEETGKTFKENALIKARAVSKFLKEKKLEFSVLSDDSGLCVDALGGAPGVYSARFSGEHGNDAGNREKLLSELTGKQNRNAKYVCDIVLMDIDGNYILSEGETKGKILESETGDKTFCYDCLFYSYDLKKCFCNCTQDEKNSISHRGRAIQNLIAKM